MNIDTVQRRARVVLDTNILISAAGFGGKPRTILLMILDGDLQAITSPILIAELEDVVTKKFPHLSKDFERVIRQLKQKFIIVKPKKALHVVKDDPDNRVLEAAMEGNCEYIITGD